MTGLRRHVRMHPLAAAWLIAAAMMMRLLVPVGYMPAADHGAIGIELCSGFGPMAMPMQGHHDRNGGSAEHGKLDAPCEFSALGSATLSGGQPPAPAAPPSSAELPPIPSAMPLRLGPSAYLRPPPRGPPLI